ncbi:MAG: cysteine desulfurase [Deltaproteobacteria bacterium]|nr:cysteine desulfurase [Deltaproteobacteria bacterium]
MSFDVARCRAEFPGLTQLVHGVPLVYLDNAATAQKPRPVVDAVDHAYLVDCANVHRGVHALSARATTEFEAVREKARSFLGARDQREIIFTSGTTDAVNLVAQTFGRQRLGAGDEIILTELEHHSNIVPWQLLAEPLGAKIRVLPINPSGALDLESLEGMLGPRAKILAVTHVSNALGTINPIKELVRRAHARGVAVFVDGAQGAPHLDLDVRDLDCDFYAFSSHKAFGPTGVGVLYGKKELLEELPPYRGGGDMIDRVTFAKTTFASIPSRFEAGTPHIAGVIGLGRALDWLGAVDRTEARAHEDELLQNATERLSRIRGLTIHGTAERKCAILSFTLRGANTQDVGTLLDQQGIAVRTGHHCAQPLMDRLGIPATVRASFALYNTHEEVEGLAHAVQRAAKLLG